MIEATREFDWFPSPRDCKRLKISWPIGLGTGGVVLSFQFDVGQYITPEMWRAFKPPTGWRKSGFYLRANKCDDRFQLIFPCVRLYANAADNPADIEYIFATLKLMQRPWP